MEKVNYLSSTNNPILASQPTKQQLADYANALIKVNNYAYGITNQQMPELNYPPTNYGNFVQKFAPAKQHALNWSQNIFVSIVQLPKTIKNEAAQLFNLEEQIITSYLNILIQDPTNQKAKKNLATSLDAIIRVIKTQVTTITAIENELKTFNVNIAADAKTLAVISADALADAGADKVLIKGLNHDILKLKEQIAAANAVITVAEIGIVLGIFIALIGVVCCFIPGAQVIGVGIIIVGAAGFGLGVAGTIIEKNAIKAFQNEIEADKVQISGLGQDIILINALSNQFNDLYNSSVDASNALVNIKAMWTNLENVINSVATELTSVENDVTSANYMKALSDFKDAETNWNEVVEFADALAGINYSWQDSKGTWHKYGDTNPSPDNGNVNSIPAA